MSIFTQELSKAHAVCKAYRAGAKTVQTLQAGTELCESEVVSWVALLRLPIARNTQSSLQFSFTSTLRGMEA